MEVKKKKVWLDLTMKMVRSLFSMILINIDNILAEKKPDHAVDAAHTHESTSDSTKLEISLEGRELYSLLICTMVVDGHAHDTSNHSPNPHHPHHPERPSTPLGIVLHMFGFDDVDDANEEEETNTKHVEESEVPAPKSAPGTPRSNNDKAVGTLGFSPTVPYPDHVEIRPISMNLTGEQIEAHLQHAKKSKDLIVDDSHDDVNM